MRSILVTWIAVATTSVVMFGCKQMGAAWDLGYENQRFKDRILKNGTNDYSEYLELQKNAIPRWHKVLDEHGEPDYILPDSGRSCQMVWMDEKLCAEPDSLGYISIGQGIPDVVAKWEQRQSTVRQNRVVRLTREAEIAIRENATRSYAESLKGIKTTKARFNIERLEYSDTTKIGMISVSVPDGDFASARMWTKFYVEMLVRDKNIALRTGETSGQTSYLMRDEQIEGKLLTVTFESM